MNAVFSELGRARLRLDPKFSSSISGGGGTSSSTNFCFTRWYDESMWNKKSCPGSYNISTRSKLPVAYTLTVRQRLQRNSFQPTVHSPFADWSQFHRTRIILGWYVQRERSDTRFFALVATSRIVML